MPSMVFVCQGGCGGFEEDASRMHRRGNAREKLYCENCIGEIDAFLGERDELHTKLAKEWQYGLLALVKRHGRKGRILPDV